MWINPDEPASTSSPATTAACGSRYDGGNRWWKCDNLPVSQFYHVSVDDNDPYQVYGGLQDNSSWVGDSAYPGGITNGRWENLYGGDGFWAFSDPADPNFAYAESQGGYIGRIEPAHARAARHPAEGRATTRSCASTGTRRSHCRRTRRARSTSARSSCSERAITARRWERISPDLTTQRSREAEAGRVGRHHRRQLGGRDAHDDLLRSAEIAEARRT